MRIAPVNTIAENINAIMKNFLGVILPDGIVRSGWAILSISMSLMSFQISVAIYPEKSVRIDSRMMRKISQS
jgi:hypothetical protein